MKIIILHWHGICPHCNKLSCIYADFYRNDDGVKLQVGFECDSCHSQISNEDFDTIKLVEMECPKGKPYVSINGKTLTPNDFEDEVRREKRRSRNE